MKRVRVSTFEDVDSEMCGKMHSYQKCFKLLSRVIKK